eukprot:TRINITY_DN12787_c0_g1_i2.p1 TRINITY_DN12787_c0_g1~~TRINITY_DN12787_c0_g1_i2.p1  ORF type:complete len:462 (-),score=236.48 TRINITY_DN12787_c0_g1_i2:205-1590(-)
MTTFEFQQRNMEDGFQEIDELFEELSEKENYMDNFFGASSDNSDPLNPPSDPSSEDDSSPSLVSDSFGGMEGYYIPGSSPLSFSDDLHSELFVGQEQVLLRGIDYDFSGAQTGLMNTDLEEFDSKENITIHDLMVVTGELGGAFTSTPQQLPPLPELKPNVKSEAKNAQVKTSPAATNPKAKTSAKNGKVSPTSASGFVELSQEQILALTSNEIEVYIKNVRMYKNPTQAQERELKRIRRLIKNREYAQNSRDKKRNHLESVEEQMGHVQQENSVLRQRINQLETENARVTGILSRLQGAIRKDPVIVARLKSQCDGSVTPNEDNGSKKRKIGGGGVFMFAILFVALFSPISNPLFNGFSFSSDALAQPSIGQSMLTKSGAIARNMLGDSLFNGGKGWAEWASAYLPSSLSEAIIDQSSSVSEQEEYENQKQRELEAGERRDNSFYNESNPIEEDDEQQRS